MPGLVVAIVAAYQAADTIADTVHALLGIDAIDSVLVVDDGSRDTTADVARAAGAHVLRLPANRGKGGAVAAGVSAIPDADIYVLVDADVGATAAAAGALLEPVLGGDADMSIGVLPVAGSRGGFGLVRDLARRGIRRATGFEAAAPLSGQRAVAGRLLRDQKLAERFGLETAMSIDVLRAGARVVEVPVPMDHRHTGRGLAGFRHRARQGIDISRALWERSTRPRTRLALIAAALITSLVWAWWSGGRWEPSSVALSERPDQVVVFGMPYVDLDDLGTGMTPNLDRLAQRGALAAMAPRGLSVRPTSAEGYTILGAGSRVRGRQDAARAYDAGDHVEGSRAADVAARISGRRSTGEVVVVGGASTIRLNSRRHVPTEPGALGEALRAAGRTTGVVGNADSPGSIDGRHRISRPAAVAVMDRGLSVGVGAVGRDLLVTDPTAPYGVRADAGKVLAATRQALARADVVVVDPGDLERAFEFRRLALDRAADAERERALRATDELLARVATTIGPKTLLLVVSVAPPNADSHLTPVVAVGRGIPHGYLHSPSTKRLGVTTATDLAPTILDALGVEVPEEMIGNPLRYHAGDPDLTYLRDLDRDSVHREEIYFPIILTFVVLQSLLYLAVMAALAREGGARAGPVLRLAALAIAAFPLATFIIRGIPDLAQLGAASVLVLLAVDVIVVALALRARRHPLSPLAWVLGATAVLIVIDVAAGARLQTTSLLGYSFHTAARFFGIGNLAFAILAACAILSVCIHVQYAPRPREATIAGAALLALVAFVEGAPSLGDDVGGILTLVPVFGLTMWVVAGRRVTWRVVVGAAVLTAAALAAAVLVDIARSPDEQTHVARFFTGEGDAGETIARKLSTNARVFGLSVWTWIVPVIALFMIYLLVWERRWSELLPARSPLRAGVVGAVAAGLLGFALNDSGIIITAAVAIYVGPFLTLLALHREPPPPTVLEPLPQDRRTSVTVAL